MGSRLDNGDQQKNFSQARLVKGLKVELGEV